MRQVSMAVVATLLLLSAVFASASVSAAPTMPPETTTPAAAPSIAPSATSSPLEGPFKAAFFSGYAAARRGPAESDLLWEKGFGTLDMRARIPMSREAHFPIASNTKLLIAVSLYQLQEQGLVDLSQPVQMYLNATDMAAFGLPDDSNWCPTVKGSNNTECRNVTFVQLLAMQAAIPNQHLLPTYYPYLGSIGSAFGLFIKEPLYYEPGTTFYYSNPAFILAGYFVEKFSGMRLADYLRVNIFDVIGMKDSYFDVFNNQFEWDEMRIDEYTTFADPTLGKVIARAPCTVEFDIGLIGGAGGVIGTAQDEARFYYTLFNFSSGAMGRPLLQDPRSLLAIVQPRTFITSPLYFGQGIIVEAANSSSFPYRAQYVGGLYCPRTANYFELVPPGDARVPLMTQAWSNGPTFFANASTWRATQQAQVGIFQEVVGGPGWGVREGNNDLAIGVFNHFNRHGK